MPPTDDDGPTMGHYTIKLPAIVRDSIDHEKVTGGVVPGSGFKGLLFTAWRLAEAIPDALDRYEAWLARQAEEDRVLKPTRRKAPQAVIDAIDREFPRRQDFAMQLGAVIHAGLERRRIKWDRLKVNGPFASVPTEPFPVSYYGVMSWGSGRLHEWLLNQEAQAALDRIFTEAGEPEHAPALSRQVPLETTHYDGKTWPSLRRLADEAARRRAEA